MVWLIYVALTQLIAVALNNIKGVNLIQAATNAGKVYRTMIQNNSTRHQHFSSITKISNLSYKLLPQTTSVQTTNAHSLYIQILAHISRSCRRRETHEIGPAFHNGKTSPLSLLLSLITSKNSPRRNASKVFISTIPFLAPCVWAPITHTPKR